MNKAFQEWSDAEDRELIDRMMPSTSAEIETAIRVVQRINYGAAFGHDPELCRATSKTLNALRTSNARPDAGRKGDNVKQSTLRQTSTQRIADIKARAGRRAAQPCSQFGRPAGLFTWRCSCGMLHMNTVMRCERCNTTR